MKRMTELEAIERLFWTVLFVALAIWQTVELYKLLFG